MKAKELTTDYQMQRWMDIIRDCEAALEVQQTVDEPKFVELSAPENEATIVTQSTIATIKVGAASIEISESISDEMLLRILKAVSHV
jgi:hypothetical protein